MQKQIKTVLKKTVKIAGVTCLALGGAALIASGAAVKALAEGGKYIAATARKILEEKNEEDAAVTADAEPIPREEPAETQKEASEI